MAIGNNIKLDQLIPEEELQAEEVGYYESESTKAYQLDFVPSRRQKVKKVKVIISGDLSIDQIMDIKSELWSGIQAYDHLSIELKEVNKLDITFLQLLIILKNYSEKYKEVKVKAALSNEHKTLIKQTGFEDLFLFINN